MAYLNAPQIKELIKQNELLIDPYVNFFQGPNLYYCHLGSTFLIPKVTNEPYNPLNPKNKDQFVKKKTEDPIILQPKEFILAESFEYFSASDRILIRLFNSSSLARSGVGHLSLGMINPGCGKYIPVRLTLELVNLAPYPIILQPTKINDDSTVTWGTEVLKIGIQDMKEAVHVSYSDWSEAIYHEDTEVQSSKMNKRFIGANGYKLGDDSYCLK